jgi:hypothetical protein
LTVQAAFNSPLVEPPPVRIPPKEFPIQTALVWSQGNIRFGFEVDRTRVTPGSTVIVRITGESQVAIKDFVVRWNETVTFQTENPRLERSITRVVASKTVLVADGHTAISLQVPLQLPRQDLRETYSGRLLQVKHWLLLRRPRV